MIEMEQLVEEIVPSTKEITESSIEGEWELIYSLVELFRSSHFVLAIEKALNNKKECTLFQALPSRSGLIWFIYCWKGRTKTRFQEKRDAFHLRQHYLRTYNHPNTWVLKTATSLWRASHHFS